MQFAILEAHVGVRGWSEFLPFFGVSAAALLHRDTSLEAGKVRRVNQLKCFEECTKGIFEMLDDQKAQDGENAQ